MIILTQMDVNSSWAKISRGTRHLNFDNESLETLIHLYKPFLVKNLKVYDLVMSPHLRNVISRETEAIIMRMERNNETMQAATIFLDALLESQDPLKWSGFRDGLGQPQHAIIVDIFERGLTEDLRNHDELRNVIDLFKKDIIEVLDPCLMCQYALQAGLLSEAEVQKVEACRRQDGDSMANFLLLSYVPRNKGWYLKFMKIIWSQGLIELVRIIDPEMFDKLLAQEGTPNGAYVEENTCSKVVGSDSGETSVKLMAAQCNTGLDAGLTCSAPISYTKLDLDNDINMVSSTSFQDKNSFSTGKHLNFNTNTEVKELNIPVENVPESYLNSRLVSTPQNMLSFDENTSSHPSNDKVPTGQHIPYVRPETIHLSSAPETNQSHSFSERYETRQRPSESASSNTYVKKKIRAVTLEELFPASRNQETVPSTQATASQHNQPKSQRNSAIQTGISAGYTIDTAVLADDDMFMHHAMLSKNLASSNNGDGEHGCRMS